MTASRGQHVPQIGRLSACVEVRDGLHPAPIGDETQIDIVAHPREDQPEGGRELQPPLQIPDYEHTVPPVRVGRASRLGRGSVFTVTLPLLTNVAGTKDETAPRDPRDPREVTRSSEPVAAPSDKRSSAEIRDIGD